MVCLIRNDLQPCQLRTETQLWFLLVVEAIALALVPEAGACSGSIEQIYGKGYIINVEVDVFWGPQTQKHEFVI